MKRKFIKPWSKIDFFCRNFSEYSPYFTIRKMINLVLNEIELISIITNPKSFAPCIKVEPSPICQLKCPGCLQSDPEYVKQFKNIELLTLKDLKKIINPISNKLIGVSLSDYGEPMLNKSLIPMIEYIHSKNIATTFPTNFSMKLSEDKIEQLAASGLDSIKISLDGASEETYIKYRINGNYNLVLKNVKLLSKAKKKRGLKRPKIIWKFVVFDHNRHEIEIVKNRYRSLGFDSYLFAYDGHGDSSAKIGRSYRRRVRKKRKPCYFPWNTMVIKWDGRVQPCCGVRPFNMGNAITEDILTIWNNKKYARLREGFFKKEYGENLPRVCKNCLGLKKS